MKKIGICIGHSRSGDSGAVTTTGVSEHVYNSEIAPEVSGILRASGFDVKVWEFYQGNGYGSSMTWIAGELKDWGADVAVELHFNAASPSANGFEYLYWHSSKNGADLAQSFLSAHAAELPQMTSRGIKSRDPNDRGAGFLSKTHCPAIILEPFFGSNSEETRYYLSDDGEETLAIIYAQALANYFA